MSQNNQRDVDVLYQKAQKILMHELTQEEQAFVAQLAFDNHASLPDEKFHKLQELVKKKGHLKSATGGF
jgi:hypothetical protein